MRYLFLVSDGNGAASRGTEVDNYFELETEAANIDEAYRNLFLQILGKDDEYRTIDDWLFDYYGIDSIDDLDPDDQDAFDNFNPKAYIDELDITGGDPWVEGIMENGNIIVKPDVKNIAKYGWNIDSDVSIRWFGWDINDDELDYMDDWEDDDFYGGDTITLADCIEFLENDKAGKILYKWLENENALSDDKDEVLDYDNILDLCAAATDRDEQLTVAHAIGTDIFDDENLEESLNNFKDMLIEYYKENLDLEDLVIDAYNYFKNDLHMDPSVMDIYDSIENDYADYDNLSEKDKSEIEKILNQLKQE